MMHDDSCSGSCGEDATCSNPSTARGPDECGSFRLMDVDAARQKLRAHESQESTGRNGVGERVRFEQQHHQRRRLADQNSNSVDLTGDLSSDEGSSAATRSGLARSQGGSQRSSPSLFARAAAPPSSSSSVRIQAKTTYSSTNRSNIMSSRFP